MVKCAILGASGHGKVVAEIAELNGFLEVQFFDDRWPELENIEHWSVVGNTETLISSINCFDQVAVAIGNNLTRISKLTRLREAGAILSPLVHPSATVSCYAKLGIGTVVMAGAVVNPFCSIGQGCIVNTMASIDHDCIINDGVHICPGVNLAGFVQVDEASWIGVGAQVKQLVKIGRNIVVGAGATVVNQIFDNETVIGTPARPINGKG